MVGGGARAFGMVFPWLVGKRICGWLEGGKIADSRMLLRFVGVISL